jgi:hypothetical protein
MGTTCGRREREADAGNEEERSSPVPAVCNGGRHPGSRDADCLRGWSVERESWSVRLGCVRLVSSHSVAPATTGVLWKNEEGNVVSVRQAHALFVADAEQAPPRSRTRPSLGPETRARQSSLSSSSSAQVGDRRRKPTEKMRVWRGGRDIAVGQTCASRRNRHRGHDCPDACAARRVSPLHGVKLVGVRVRRKKRKVVMAIVPARKRELGLVARTS